MISNVQLKMYCIGLPVKQGQQSDHDNVHNATHFTDSPDDTLDPRRSLYEHLPLLGLGMDHPGWQCLTPSSSYKNITTEIHCEMGPGCF